MPLDQPQDQVEVPQVDLDRLGDARVLDLDGDLLAVVGARAVDLADRGGGEAPRDRTRRSASLDRAAELGLDHLADVLEAELRRLSRSWASAARNSSCPSSERPGSSTVERTWPIFIAAPFISPSWRAICTAIAADALVGRALGALLVAGDVRDRVPAQRRPWPATIPPTPAVRPIRPVRIRGESSLAAEPPDPRPPLRRLFGHHAASRDRDAAAADSARREHAALDVLGVGADGQLAHRRTADRRRSRTASGSASAAARP